MKQEKFDFEEFSRQAGELLRQGKPLTGKDGVFKPLLKRILEASLEGELDDALRVVCAKCCPKTFVFG
jgi:putative transposase